MLQFVLDITPQSSPEMSYLYCLKKIDSILAVNPAAVLEVGGGYDGKSPIRIMSAFRRWLKSN